jgi:hypothetical protein
MEREGAVIHWLDGNMHIAEKVDRAMKLLMV